MILKSPYFRAFYKKHFQPFQLLSCTETFTHQLLYYVLKPPPLAERPEKVQPFRRGVRREKPITTMRDIMTKQAAFFR